MPPIHRTLFGPFPLDLGEPYPSPFPYPNPTSLPTFPFPGPAASSPLVVPVDWKETRTFPFPFPGPGAAASSQLVGPPVDWKETREAHVFMADVPGLRKEEVLVEAEEGNVLKISGGRTAAEKEKEKEKERAKTWHLAERSTGSFLRRFWLPENVRMDRASATMANGVLTVTIPKERPKKPEINSIEIHG